MDDIKNKKIKHFSIKKYNDDNFKIILYKTALFIPEYQGYDLDPKSRSINDKKLDNNLSRAKSKIFEYALCNDFDYFVTFTLSKDKRDRYDLKGFIKDLGQFIRNLRRLKNYDIQYLLIPEPHKDGAWHMHGLLKGIPLEQLTLFTLEDNLPYRLLEMLKKGRKIYSWGGYSEKFGFCTLEPIISKIKVSKYISKYISKTLKADLNREKEKKLYYTSKGLNTALTVYNGLYNPKIDIDLDFENEYVATKMLNYTEFLSLKLHLDKLEEIF